MATYSGGMRRRLDIAAGLVAEPEVIFLDEPTTGLDPRSRQGMWEVVSRARRVRRDRLPDHAVPRGGRPAGRPHRGHQRRAASSPRAALTSSSAGSADSGSTCSSPTRRPSPQTQAYLGRRAIHLDRATLTLGVATEARLPDVRPCWTSSTRTRRIDRPVRRCTPRASTTSSCPSPERHPLMSEYALTCPLPRTAAPAVTDAWTLVTRAFRLSLRNVDGLITALALPVMLMLMFVYLFGGAINVGGLYVDYVVPGVLLVCVGFGAATTAVSVAHDLTGGIIDRFRSMDVRGEALINGHVVASVARNLLSSLLVFAVAFAIGFRSSAGLAGWLAAAGVLALFVLALSWFAATVGILARSPEAANGMTFLVSFLPYASSAFVPIRTMPGWLQGFARNQPVTAVVDALRGFVGGTLAATSAWHAIAWSLGIIAVSVAAAGVLFRRRAR